MTVTGGALLLVDLQNDFCPGGALPVPEGHLVIPVANRLQPYFTLVVACQDWHPADHGSFAANHPGKQPGDRIDLNGLEQILWPVHCIQNTSGAAFVPNLELQSIARVFRKGTDPAVDSYSAFFDNGRRHSTGLGEFLKERGIGTLCILGLATDYCVRYSVLDALSLGQRTFVVEDGCRGVNLSPGDSAAAWREMRQAGATLIQSGHIRQT